MKVSSNIVLEIDRRINMESLPSNSLGVKIAKIVRAIFIGISVGYCQINAEISSQVKLPIFSKSVGVLCGMTVGVVEGVLTAIKFARQSLRNENLVSEVLRAELNDIFNDPILAFKLFYYSEEEGAALFEDKLYSQTAPLFQRLSILNETSLDSIARAIENNKGEELKFAFISILRDLNKKDSKLLKKLFIHCALIAEHKFALKIKILKNRGINTEDVHEIQGIQDFVIGEILEKIASSLIPESRITNNRDYHNVRIFVRSMIQFSMKEVISELKNEYHNKSNIKDPENFKGLTELDRSVYGGFVSISRNRAVWTFNHKYRKYQESQAKA